MRLWRILFHVLLDEWVHARAVVHIVPSLHFLATVREERRGEERGERVMEMIPIAFASPLNERQETRSLWRRTFDPDSRFIINWSRFLFVVEFFGFGIDLLLFFVKRVEGSSINIDFKLASLIPSLRMLGDSCQFLGIIVKFRTAFEDSKNGIFKRSELVQDPKIIAERYLKSSFIIDVAATLPLPEVILLLCQLILVWFDVNFLFCFVEDHPIILIHGVIC